MFHVLLLNSSRTAFASLGAVFLAGVLMTSGVFAQTEADLSPEQEARYHVLLQELRCLVCQNQSLAESDAELAGDLRDQVLRMVYDDVSDDEIFTFMTDRYGSFVRYRPPFNITTLLLWVGPFIVLLAGLAVLFRQIAKRNRPVDDSAAES